VSRHRRTAWTGSGASSARELPDRETAAALSPRVPLTPGLAALRVLVLLTAVLGLNYVVWRWLESINWSAWWIAVPLVLAETYSLVDSLLFGLTMWRLRRRRQPPPPPEGATVDVFITTYNEPVDLVMATAEAAQRIRYPHRTWILDDGARPELRERAEAAGIGVITRSGEWAGRQRHAKAGNLNNALMTTDGEFILILDADQVPDPAILDRTLGYFRDPQMALVQTPQVFVNVPEDDPLGSQAPLFYGPIQQGKDGWNAAFFCGSNAVLRREALMQLGVSRYVTEVELAVTRTLRTADRVLARARKGLDPVQTEARAALDAVAEAVAVSRADLRAGAALADVTYRFQQQVDAAARRLVDADVTALESDLAEIAALSAELDGEEAGPAELDRAELARLAHRDWSPLGAIETVRALVRAIDVDRDDEAQPLMPMATISVTEDMATCMRLHALGWRTAYHHETLALGLAPEDLGTMLTQRLRWAQGTVQVMLRENPLVQRGLTLAQRLMYWATMWSYLSGFAAVVYFAAPVVFLVSGILPVQSLSADFFLRLVPFLAVNQLLFYLIGRGRGSWRGQQYSLALFPVWIRSVTSAVSNVVFGRSLAFAVTPKERQAVARRPWHLVRVQLLVMAVLVVAAVVGTVRMVTGEASVLGTAVNLVWVAFDLAVLSVIIEAVRYRGPDTEPAEVPA
jgi:cellulose synthase (UDP-forming)